MTTAVRIRRRLWMYQDKTEADLGAVRWSVEWYTAKPTAIARIASAEAAGTYDELDPDRDLICHGRDYPTKAGAMRAARGIVNLGQTAYGCATVQAEVADAIDGAPDYGRMSYGEWVPSGDRIEVA